MTSRSREHSNRWTSAFISPLIPVFDHLSLSYISQHTCGLLDFCSYQPSRFLNIRLDAITVADETRHPHMMAVKNCFIRGSVVRYVQLPADQVDTNLLEDATRRGTYRVRLPHLHLLCRKRG
jgi:hypothetical protein